MGSVTYLYIRKNNVIILAVTKANVDAMLAFRFMSSVGLGSGVGFLLLQELLHATL